MMSSRLVFGMFRGTGSLDVELRVGRFRTVLESSCPFRSADDSVRASLRNCLGDDGGIFPTGADTPVELCALTTSFCGEPDHFG